MKFFVLAALFSAASVSALPALAIDTSRQFDCPPRVSDYCHAPNIHGGCSFAGSFSSSDPTTCGGCSCF
ncbi:hypothetical protein VHEMI05818 [[Torrubiella] hemipterigena]|uniref:Uncharacterized protein n=1 Tax=[Torrubiella] hemipterigena TaxID=1531966 RepID=A0A0A1SYW6_9HYPO|nr:hypothetical protein VHEMI05818 [[Torrubiella] hemipterigena]